MYIFSRVTYITNENYTQKKTHIYFWAPKLYNKNREGIARRCCDYNVVKMN